MDARGLFNRVCNEIAKRSEDEVVKTFLKSSENFKKLKDIKKVSQRSKEGSSILPSWCYQLHSSEENKISQLSNVKSFAELLKLLSIDLDQVPPMLVSIVSILANVSQKPNAAYYFYQLAVEATDYAKKHGYDISETKQNYYTFSN